MTSNIRTRGEIQRSSCWISGLLALTFAWHVAPCSAGYIASSYISPTGVVQIDEGQSLAFGSGYSWVPQNYYDSTNPRWQWGNGQYYTVVGYGNEYGRTQDMTFYSYVNEFPVQGAISTSDNAGHSSSLSVHGYGGTAAYNWLYADEGDFTINSQFLTHYQHEQSGNYCTYGWANYFTGQAWCSSNTTYSNVYSTTSSSRLSIGVHVRNIAPSIQSILAPSTVDVGQSFSFSALATDPGVFDVLTYAWDLDEDGVYGEFIGTAGQWVFSHASPHSIGVRVTDGDGGSATQRFNIEVSDSIEIAGVSEPGAIGLIFLGIAVLMRGRCRIRVLRS